MVQAIRQSVTFEEFIAWKPENGCYELRRGVIVEMQPKGKHEEVIGFLSLELTVEVRRLQLPYFLPKQALLNSSSEEDTSYLPDLLWIDRRNLQSEPLWERASTITQGKSVPLIIEVVSTNWRDDYLKKLADYEELGIKEYWIVDYLGLGGRRFLGNPKQPTLSVCILDEGGEYQIVQFRGSDRIVSHVFPNLTLTAEQIFQAGQ